jgi:transcriptional activator SPT8
VTTEQKKEPNVQQEEEEEEAKSEASYDPLFDDGPPPTPPPTQAKGKAPPSNAPPLLDGTMYSTFSPDMLMTTAADGQVMLWDKRSHDGKVGRLWMDQKTPPLCLSGCWSADGLQIYAARRNNTVDVWDIRHCGERTLTALKNPPSSGIVSSVVAFPDNRHVAWYVRLCLVHSNFLTTTAQCITR